MNARIHDVAVIGAGISGLTVAGRLRDAGLQVLVLEKSRGVGGRAATRRVEVAPGVQVPVDHGAQFFTARDIRFQKHVARWEQEGVCFPWTEGFWTWKEGRLHPPDPQWNETRYACREGMSRLGKYLAEGLEVIREFQVSSLGLKGGIWHLEADPKHPLAPVAARALLLSAPPPQALKLTGEYLTAEQRAYVERISCEPCVAVIARYPGGTEPPPWSGIQVRYPESRLSWMAWDSSRRAKTLASAGIAVLHGSPGFSRRCLDASKEELTMAGSELLDEAAMIAGAWMGVPVEFCVHRWRFAHQEGPNAPGGFLRADTASPLYLIGDGLNGGRVEGAWLSGVFAAEDLLLRGRGK
ncbi:MAG: FAD-dependent oxidoreductase [Verrucomicrobia bacterium]|nr:FAD-dependent oxidoreductase [Verrucomicrobiota bacterium]